MKIKLGKLAKNVISKFAPTIATALGGPAAGSAIEMLKETLGANNDAELEKIIATASPEQLAAIKKADQDFEIRLKELDIDIFALETADMQDARNFARTDMRPQMVLSALYTVGYFLMVVGLLAQWFVIPDGAAGGVANALIGVLTAAQIKILDFWFGSSHGSKTK